MHSVSVRCVPAAHWVFVLGIIKKQLGGGSSGGEDGEGGKVGGDGDGGGGDGGGGDRGIGARSGIYPGT